MMVGKVHEAVHQVRLAHICGQSTQLLVGGQATPPWGLPHGPFLEHLGLPCQLHCSALSGATCIQVSLWIPACSVRLVILYGLSSEGDFTSLVNTLCTSVKNGQISQRLRPTFLLAYQATPSGCWPISKLTISTARMLSTGT